jgi:uncharacterized membrane protein/thiol-disulfide isomerase/thioredoxin
MTRLLFSLLTLSIGWGSLQAPQAVVRAVLFYSPQCGHCHVVINEVLPPLVEKYGAQLEIIGVDVTQPDGQRYFQLALQKFNLQSSGVPFLVVGDEYLVGSVDIPEKFPGLIEKHLARGGVEWPAIPELAKILPQATSTIPPTLQAAPSVLPTLTLPLAISPTPLPGLGLAGTQSPPSLAGNLARDPLGNGLAIFVLLGMVMVAGFAAINFPRLAGAAPQGWQGWLIPILTLAGLVVAGYLTYVETAQVNAVCGPVGDCNTVQQSQYARLFGVLPIGLLGLAGYVFILAAWLVGRLDRKPLSTYADLALLAMTTLGLLFSIYLTFLEPFVIGATCAWCLTSAILITALFWLSLMPGKQAYLDLSNRLSAQIPKNR